MSLFDARDEYEVGRDYGRGWIVLRPTAEGVRLAIGQRGAGHDELSTYRSYDLSWAETAELSAALALALPPGTVASATRQWEPKTCDKCGEPIRAAKDYAAGSYRVRNLILGWREARGEWHIGCAPREFLERWSWR